MQVNHEFLKSIQDEYATRYCELQGLKPNAINKRNVLERRPLTSCEVVANWNSSGWLADNVQIFPHKPKRNSFEK